MTNCICAELPAKRSFSISTDMRFFLFLSLLSVASAQTITQPSASAINADFKLNVRVATTANITIATALNAGDTIDGVTLAAGDRVLVKNQSTASQNGIYIAGATPARASDADAWSEIPGAFVSVGSEGSTTANKIYLCTATPTGTLGSTSITWAEKGAAGAGTGDALVADSLAQFAATTSSQLAGVLSDEEGSGKAIFGTGVSEGGNEAADAGKLLKFQAGGDIQGTTVKATDTAGYMYFTSQGEFAYKLAAWTNPAGINWPPDIGDGQSGNIASREWAATQYAPLTSPAIATSITTGSTTFALLNTTATTVNAFGAATTLNVGASAATVLNLGGAATAAQLRFLEPSGSGTNYMGFKAQAMAANVTYTLPAADGSSGQVLKTDGAGTLSWVTAGSGSGTKTIARFFPRDNEPPATNFATLDTRNSHPCLDFDTTTQESAIFRGIIPEGSVMTSGVTVCVQWAATSATSGTIGWDVAFERIASGGIDIDSDSFGTAQTVTATTVSGTSGITTLTSVNFSQAQLPSSLAAGEMYRVRIRRDVATDTASGDEELLGVEIKLQ